MRSLYDFLVDVYTRFSNDAGSFLAATISYYALFSIFPLLLLAISAAGFFLTARGGTEDILRYTNSVIPQFSGVVRSNVEAIAANRGSVGVIGLLALLWAGTAVFEAIEFTLDKVWKVPVGRHFLLSKLLSIAGAVAVIMLLLLTTLVSAGFETFQNYWHETFTVEPPLAALQAGARLLGLAVTLAAVVIIYKVVPNLKLRISEVLPGAVFATLAWDLAKRLFVLYTTRAAKFNAVYGSVGVIVGLLFWLYITGMILVLGAEINAALRARRETSER